MTYKVEQEISRNQNSKQKYYIPCNNETDTHKWPFLVFSKSKNLTSLENTNHLSIPVYCCSQNQQGRIPNYLGKAFKFSPPWIYTLKFPEQLLISIVMNLKKKMKGSVVTGVCGSRMFSEMLLEKYFSYVLEKK